MTFISPESNLGLGNILYFLLYVYVRNSKLVFNSSVLIKDIVEKLFKLNDLISENLPGTIRLKSYCQDFGNDFTEDDLNSFIKSFILNYDFLSAIDKIDLHNEVAIHIRNTNYLWTANWKRYGYDVLMYLANSICSIEDYSQKTFVVVSDDIKYSQKEYDHIFKDLKVKVKYRLSKLVFDDFVFLCAHKNKIITNSAFSVWSAYISNVIFGNSFENIICPDIVGHNLTYTIYNPKWKLMKCLTGHFYDNICENYINFIDKQLSKLHLSLKKRLIIVGNKSNISDISSDVDSFDYVVRLNRMSNYGLSGIKTDLLLADTCPNFIRLCTPPYDKYLNALKLLVNSGHYCMMYKNECLQKKIFRKDQYDNAWYFDLWKYVEAINPFTIDFRYRIFPTNFFVMLLWCIENLSSEYDIWITGIDIDNRDSLFTESNVWNISQHANEGIIEKTVINHLIEKLHIHILNSSAISVSSNRLKIKLPVKVYMLTIEGSRRHKIQKKQLEDLGIDCEFVFAKTFSDEFIQNTVKSDSQYWKLSLFSKLKKYLNRAYSCAYGHQLMLKNFLSDTEYEYGLFLEDDALLFNDTMHQLDAITRKFSNYTVWHLSTEAVKIYRLQYNEHLVLSNALQLVKPDGFSAIAYMATKSGALTLFNSNNPIQGPSDIMMFLHGIQFAEVYGSKIGINADLQANSEIGDKRIKIIIPFKEKSVRCPGKNFKLFHYVVDWIKKQNFSLNDTYVVSDSEIVKLFVEKSGVNFIHEKKLDNPNNIFAAYYAAKELGLTEYIELPITQPLRSSNLISIMIDQLNKNSNADFITTTQNISDRHIFYLDNNDKFISESKNRKGSMCNTVKMIDGAIYAIRTSFIDRIADSDDINASFWAGNFKTIHNDVPVLVDVDTEDDMKLVQLISKNTVNDFLFISNVCTADYLNFALGRGHLTPFDSSAVDDEDFISMAGNLDDLSFDFTNPIPYSKIKVISRGYTWTGYNKDHNIDTMKTFGLNCKILDKNIQVYYRHFEMTDLNLVKIIHRYDRMKKLKTMIPFFIYQVTPNMNNCISVDFQIEMMKRFMMNPYPYKLYINGNKQVYALIPDFFKNNVIGTFQIHEPLVDMIFQYFKTIGIQV